MTLFRKALLDRYPDFLIMTRPAPAPALELLAFRKKDGDRKWEKLAETHPLPMNIMLSSYKPPTVLCLPPLVDECAEDSQESQAAGGEQEGMIYE
jgi:hypothetical protein